MGKRKKNKQVSEDLKSVNKSISRNSHNSRNSRSSHSSRSSRSRSNSRSIDKKDIYISEYDEKYMLLQPVSISMKKEWEEVLESLKPIWKSDKEGWLIKQDKLDDLYRILEVELDTSDSDDSDSTDDELIQKALGRKLMCESSGKIIEKEDVEDSEMEDVVSMSRRFRFIYNELKTIKERLNALEKQQII